MAFVNLLSQCFLLNSELQPVANDLLILVVFFFFKGLNSTTTAELLSNNKKLLTFRSWSYYSVLFLRTAFSSVWLKVCTRPTITPLRSHCWGELNSVIGCCFRVGCAEAERSDEVAVQRIDFSGGDRPVTLYSQDRCPAAPALPAARTYGPRWGGYHPNWPIYITHGCRWHAL